MSKSEKYARCRLLKNAEITGVDPFDSASMNSRRFYDCAYRVPALVDLENAKVTLNSALQRHTTSTKLSHPLMHPRCFCATLFVSSLRAVPPRKSNSSIAMGSRRGPHVHQLAGSLAISKNSIRFSSPSLWPKGRLLTDDVYDA